MMNFGIDFHGLVIDHRRAKYEFFRDELGLDYGDYHLDRTSIIETLKPLGMSPEIYFKYFHSFIQSKYYECSVPVPNSATSIKEMAALGCVYIVTTARYNTICGVREILRRHSIEDVRDILLAEDKSRAEVLKENEISLYFDDKPDLLPGIAKLGIETVLISDLEKHQAARSDGRVFPDWPSALAESRGIAREFAQGNSSVRGHCNHNSKLLAQQILPSGALSEIPLD